MKTIVTLIVLFFSSILAAQDTAKVLIVQNRGQQFTVRCGQEIKVEVSGKQCKGILREVTDSTIRVENDKGGVTFRLASITAITWYDVEGKKTGVGPTLIAAGGVVTLAGTTLFLLAMNNSGSDALSYVVSGIAGMIIATPLVVGGLVLMGIGIVNTATQDSHRRRIGEDTQLHVGGGKPAATPSTTQPEKKRTTVE